RQLEAHATHLREICAAAAVSVNGLDQAESRLAAIQSDVQLHLTDLSRTLQSLVADLRAGTSQGLSTPGPAAAWPLDRVVQLHDELRRGASDQEPAPRPAPPGGSSGPAPVQSHHDEDDNRHDVDAP